MATSPATAVPSVPRPPTTPYRPAQGHIHSDPSIGWIQRFLPLLAAHKRVLTVSLTAALIGTAATMTTPIILQQAIDRSLLDRSGPLSDHVWMLTGLVVVGWIAMVVNRRMLIRASALVEYDLRSILQRHLGRQSHAFFDQAQTGQLISRVNSDLRAIQQFLVFAPAVAILFVGFFYALAIMFRAHVGLTLITLSTMPLVLWVGIRMRRVTFPLAWLVQARTADVTSIVEENLAGAHVVRAMAAEEHQIRQLDVSAESLRWAAVREVGKRARFQPLMSAIPQMGTALFLLVAGWLAARGAVTVGTIVLFTLYVGLLQFPFQVLGMMVMMAQRARAASGRILELLDSAPSVQDSSTAVHLAAVTGEVRFEHVDFSYPDDTPVLRDVSMTIRPGEKVALVGRAASGKSTLLGLVPRFYDATTGCVRVDGHDVRDVSQASLRNHVGIVSEDPFLFTASIRDNIAYARPDAPDDVIRQAADIAGALEFIEELPDGWDTVVGERGYTLSGGQRQRIAIARTLVHDPTILLLDDATSAVDVEIERRIHGALRGALTTRTTILVAHRPATIALADRVVLLVDGRIVAEGTHDELLAREPRYRDILTRPDADSNPAPRQGERRQQSVIDDHALAERPDAVTDLLR